MWRDVLIGQDGTGTLRGHWLEMESPYLDPLREVEGKDRVVLLSFCMGTC